MNKVARMKGLGRTLKPACNCKSRCYEQITEVDRLIIFDDFWKNHCSWEEKRRYIAKRVTRIKIKRRTMRGRDETRSCSRRYVLRINEEDVKVCKTMFLNTLDIGIAFVNSTFNKMKVDGFFEPDMRGKKSSANKTSEAIVQSVKNHISSNLCPRQNNQKKGREIKPNIDVKKMYQNYEEDMQKKGRNESQYAKLWLYRKVFRTDFAT